MIKNCWIKIKNIYLTDDTNENEKAKPTEKCVIK